jgi:hypothetical protein
MKVGDLVTLKHSADMFIGGGSLGIVIRKIRMHGLIFWTIALNIEGHMKFYSLREKHLEVLS